MKPEENHSTGSFHLSGKDIGFATLIQTKNCLGGLFLDNSVVKFTATCSLIYFTKVYSDNGITNCFIEDYV